MFNSKVIFHPTKLEKLFRSYLQINKTKVQLKVKSTMINPLKQSKQVTKFKEYKIVNRIV